MVRGVRGSNGAAAAWAVAPEVVSPPRARPAALGATGAVNATPAVGLVSLGKATTLSRPTAVQAAGGDENAGPTATTTKPSRPATTSPVPLVRATPHRGAARTATTTTTPTRAIAVPAAAAPAVVDSSEPMVTTYTKVVDAATGAVSIVAAQTPAPRRAADAIVPATMGATMRALRTRRRHDAAPVSTAAAAAVAAAAPPSSQPPATDEERGAAELEAATRLLAKLKAQELEDAAPASGLRAPVAALYRAVCAAWRTMAEHPYLTAAVLGGAIAGGWYLAHRASPAPSTVLPPALPYAAAAGVASSSSSAAGTPSSVSMSSGSGPSGSGLTGPARVTAALRAGMASAMAAAAMAALQPPRGGAASQSRQWADELVAPCLTVAAAAAARGSSHTPGLPSHAARQAVLASGMSVCIAAATAAAAATSGAPRLGAVPLPPATADTPFALLRALPALIHAAASARASPL